MNSPINDNITSLLFSLICKTKFVSNNLNILSISYDPEKINSLLINEYNNCNVHNIKIDSYPKTNTINLDYEKNYFDLIILDDIIQKFVDPWDILQRLHSLLKKDGYLFASIPNIMHINNLVNIINGRFELTISGPLDKDNLRFFTLNSIRDLFLSTGFNLHEISCLSTEQGPKELSIINLITPSTEPDFINQYFCFEYILKTSPCEIKTLFDYIL